jgi:hypothetical protein
VTRRVAVVLGVVFVLLGVVETVRDITGGDGGYVFWFTSLCGGGSAILVGVLKLAHRPAISAAAAIILVTLVIADVGKLQPRPARG